MLGNSGAEVSFDFDVEEDQILVQKNILSYVKLAKPTIPSTGPGWVPLSNPNSTQGTPPNHADLFLTAFKKDHRNTFKPASVQIPLNDANYATLKQVLTPLISDAISVSASILSKTPDISLLAFLDHPDIKNYASKDFKNNFPLVNEFWLHNPEFNCCTIKGESPRAFLIDMLSSLYSYGAKLQTNPTEVTQACLDTHSKKAILVFQLDYTTNKKKKAFRPLNPGLSSHMETKAPAQEKKRGIQRNTVRTFTTQTKTASTQGKAATARVNVIQVPTTLKKNHLPFNPSPPRSKKKTLLSCLATHKPLEIPELYETPTIKHPTVTKLPHTYKAIFPVSQHMPCRKPPY